MIIQEGIAPFNKDYKKGALKLREEALLAITILCSMKHSTSEAVRLWLCIGCGCDTTLPAKKKLHSPHGIRRVLVGRGRQGMGRRSRRVVGFRMFAVLCGGGRGHSPGVGCGCPISATIGDLSIRK